MLKRNNNSCPPVLILLGPSCLIQTLVGFEKIPNKLVSNWTEYKNESDIVFEAVICEMWQLSFSMKCI